jgi:hypothetical protein
MGAQGSRSNGPSGPPRQRARRGGELGLDGVADLGLQEFPDVESAEVVADLGEEFLGAGHRDFLSERDAVGEWSQNRRPGGRGSCGDAGNGLVTAVGGQDVITSSWSGWWAGPEGVVVAGVQDPPGSAAGEVVGGTAGEDAGELSGGGEGYRVDAGRESEDVVVEADESPGPAVVEAGCGVAGADRCTVAVGEDSGHPGRQGHGRRPQEVQLRTVRVGSFWVPQ